MVVISGEVINNTGTTQEIISVTGTFYDDQGQIITADKNTTGSWPTRLVPPAGQIPFSLAVYDIKEAASFDLSVHAETLDTPARQNFEFLAVTELHRGTRYCLGGTLRNLEDATVNSLVIAAIVYDEQGTMLRFGTDNAVALAVDQAQNFEVCFKSPPDNIARHELRAWGI
jgi:hypothetical protein